MYCTPTETRTARKSHRCTYCAEQIEVGEQYLRWMNVDNDKAVTNKLHPECLAFLEENACGEQFEYPLYEGERPIGMNTDSVIRKESVQRFLKDGETVEQCLVRNRRDIDILLGLLAKEREKSDIVRPHESPRWRDAVEEPPQEAQEVLFVHGGKTVRGAWVGGAFWHNNQRCSTAAWFPLPAPPKSYVGETAKYNEDCSLPCDVPDCGLGT